MKATERLEQQLDEKDEEISELEQKLEEANRLLEASGQWQWPHDVPESADLPIPRLEIVWSKADEDRGWYERKAIYRLVTRHFLGKPMAFVLGNTTVRGGDGSPPIYDGRIDTPFREGAHIRHDAKQLNLPAFIVCEDKWRPVNMTEGERP